MQVTSSTFIIAEYCQQMREKSIVVNHDYQRSDKVWPPAARSYLIETILLGFPIPKLSLYQTTDLKTKKTKKEIVDGQQRSQVISDFLEGTFRLTGKGPFGGRLFGQLDEPEQQRFVDYALTVDVFVGATPHEIRQVFRRMNSYTVPLNPQEKRHATHQGELKWFIVDMVEKYSEALKKIGVFGERQLSRMADAALLSDIAFTFSEGIKNASDRSLDNFYSDNESSFPDAESLRNRLTSAMDIIFGWTDIHSSTLMKSYNFYSLVLAISHALNPVQQSNLNETYPRPNPIQLDPQYALPNLTALAAALEEPNTYPQFAEYVAACSKATTRIEQRKTRFIWLSRALEPQLLS
ncbi:MAG: DUF262 domain-containing protein [Nitrospiraceae bacterium]|nr:DUF262 domain-containing protein [Nitrospiraceae bacterium]